MMASLAIMKLIAVGAVVLALIPWGAQDFIASFAASEMMTVTKLRTTEERDDARVLRAFSEAKRTQRVVADLVTEPNPKQQTRDATLTVRAKTKAEALAGREAMAGAMKAAFAKDGPGELFDIGNAPSAKPVPDAATATVKQVCNGISVAFLLGGLLLIVNQWRRSPLPKVAILGIPGTVGTFLLIGEHEGGAILVPLMLAAVPVLILVLVTRVTLRVRKAATWVEGRARITKSKTEVERHRFSGDTTTVKNKAAVEYDFTAGSKTIHGDCISIGDAPADATVGESGGMRAGAEAEAARYPEGAEVEVHYDPKNPTTSALEVDTEMMITGNNSLVVALVLFAVAIYAALN